MNGHIYPGQPHLSDRRRAIAGRRLIRNAVQPSRESNQMIAVHRTPLEGLLLLEPQVFADERGFFVESFNDADFRTATGITEDFVQDNHSRSVRNVLRGLHYQVGQTQGRLVCVSSGRAFDVVVDLRRGSPSLGEWFGVELSDENHKQLWIPAGFAHGFLALSEHVDFLYKTTRYYSPEDERAIRWDDSDIGIEWPLSGRPILSGKDREAGSFTSAELLD